MAKIQDYINTYAQGTVVVSNGVTYNQQDIINEAYRLYNGKFLDDSESGGLKKIFFRMIWIIFRTIIMSSDIDLKDMNMRSLNGKGIKTLALIKLATHSHLLRTGFGKYVDEVMARMVWFGSSITKRVNGKVEIVDLRNYITEPHIKNPQERSHVEKCFYTWDEMQSYKEDWKDNWTAIEDEWERMQKRNETLFKVIEFWTWDTIDKNTHKVCIKYLDRSEDEPNNSKDSSDWTPYLELDKFITPYKKPRESKFLIKKLGEYEEIFPYEQADFFDCPGRQLGMGCAELLSGLNQLYQETGNNKRKSDLLGLRSIFKHKYTNTSNSLTQEFLDNLETGSVLSMSVDEDLERLIIDTKTQDYLISMDKLYELMRLVMGVTAQGTGEELPGSTSATGVKANFAAQQTTYDFVRERMHHFLQNLFMNGYFNDIMDEISSEEMVAITGDPKELAQIDKALIEKAVGNATEQRYNQLKQSREQVDEEGNVIQEGYATWDEVQTLQDLEEAEIKQLNEELKQIGDTRWATIKKDLLKYLHYTIEFFVTSESFDKQSKLENYRLLLADPNFTGSRQAVQDAIFDLTNENPRAFDKTPEEKQAEAEQIRQQMIQESQNGAIPPPMEMAVPTI